MILRDTRPDVCPGLRAVELPPHVVQVLDPSGKHRLFKTAKFGTRTGANCRGEQVWTVCVVVGGVTHVVPPNWICDCETSEALPTELPEPGDNVVAFPSRGPFAAQVTP